MNKKDFEKFANIFRSMTGSTMKDEMILKEYNSFSEKKHKILFKKIDEIIKERNLPFDQALPLITVELNSLATKEDTDPAALLMIYITYMSREKE